MPETDKVFAGSIPEDYDRYLVPLIFESFARDIAQRAAALSPRSVLETAAGSGVQQHQKPELWKDPDEPRTKRQSDQRDENDKQYCFPGPGGSHEEYNGHYQQQQLIGSDCR